VDNSGLGRNHGTGSESHDRSQVKSLCAPSCPLWLSLFLHKPITTKDTKATDKLSERLRSPLQGAVSRGEPESAAECMDEWDS
jgi:hypothetical protein